MGKGDKRTKRGKMFRGTNGKSIPGKKVTPAAKTEPKAAAKPPRAAREPREQPVAAPASEA